MNEVFGALGIGMTDADWFMRLVFSLVAGGILGLDREVRHRRVGVRTYMMVSLGSAIFTITAIEMSRSMGTAELAADPTRVIQGLIGGLGFLGAGAIIQGDKNVGGMATAASLWVAGAAGVLAASRFMEHRGADDRPDTKR